MNANQKQQLYEHTVSEMRQFADRPIVWQMDLATAMGMCGAMQLALRHPDFQSKPSADLVRTFLMQFVDSIPENYPAIRQTIRLGFHPRFDEPSSLSGPEHL